MYDRGRMAAMAMPELPWRCRPGFHPQTLMLRLRFVLGERICLALPGCLLGLVFPVVPGVTGRDLFEPGVHAIGACGARAVGSGDEHASNDPPIAIALAPQHDDVLSMDEGGEVSLRECTERLILFRRVDAGETDLVLDLCVVEHDNRIAIGNADNASGKLGCTTYRAGKAQREHEYRPTADAALHADTDALTSHRAHHPGAVSWMG